ncbi:phosphoribosylamine--glycine ligase [Candidatus Peregrinibacteria bacterium CG10_big_fil_rev_8_21_14_0_10_49_24]|nr:MAG: phosphoribosylamine--glycine ligase [Candidatus Peregrinibacteria bacterium CG11_big_fil_rev_8_21_14_0_20_49_14]PIR50733.1 MAG: phosphoribosylamine--glycine ligase [Candidatus Peregrinibacteria bacterium CG10_big_fil_rev_8_21_14_0_10_49_24]PJA68222.1 MAG: phosphoribosylamine--glycine ligase [Candidatus Peregrinibacteria bacterium CG_4_9_14_3_um_filter_49_12]
MNILLITSSARGHAIAEALSRSSHKPSIIAVSPSGNPGIKRIADEQHVMDIMDFDAIADIAKKTKPAFAFIGPDDPIGAGLADVLENMGIPTVAPKKSLARIEASKGFTRELLERNGVYASPKFRLFNRAEPEILNTYIAQELGGEYVVKYDALKGGKGVKISGEHLSSVEDGVRYAMECIEECGQVVIEEKLVGVEFSLLSFVSGTQVADMPAVQDHKRAFEGDTGPNTGGMGTYSDANHSLPFLSDADIARAKEINRLTAAALQKECGEGFRGILYGGFIAVRDGVRLIEYNARFGDPEALNILPILQSDFVDICTAMISGELSEDLVTFKHKATVCKYITPQGYPDNKNQKGETVTFPHIGENARLYYGDITENDDGSLALGSSRTAGIVGIADTISEAEKIAQQLCEQVQGPVRFRADIGTDELVSQRSTTMEQLRS